MVPGGSGDPEALLAFHAEDGPAKKPGAAGRSRRSVWFKLLMGTLALAIAGGAGAGYWYWRLGQGQSLPLPPASAPVTLPPVAVEGTTTISSRPEGAQVLVNGVPRGITPLKLSLPVGEHTLELQNGLARRSLTLVIEAGTISSQYIDLAPTSPTAAGRLEVTSDPVGADVAVDGVPRGVTPLIISAMAAGQHRVVISDGDRKSVV